MTDFTRKAYLNKECTHAEYYQSINAAGGVQYSGDIDRVRQALEAGDEHLNTIPLGHWDAQIYQPIPAKLAKAFRDAGDYPTLAGLVCCSKQAAKDAA